MYLYSMGPLNVTDMSFMFGYNPEFNNGGSPSIEMSGIHPKFSTVAQSLCPKTFRMISLLMVSLIQHGIH
jgi:hypothetical protein